MRHGTCSDYNQFCPNARLTTNAVRHVPLVSQSVASLGGHYHHHPELPRSTSVPKHPLMGRVVQTADPLLQKQRYLHLSRSRNTRSHQSLFVCESSSVFPKATLMSAIVTTSSSATTTATNTAYHPLLLHETLTPVAADLTGNSSSYAATPSVRSHPFVKLPHMNNNNLRSAACACCSTGAPSSNGDSMGPTPLDCYREHMLQFFYRENNNNNINQKQIGSVSGRRSSNLVSPQSLSSATGIPESDSNGGHGHSGNVYVVFDYDLCLLFNA